jgi:hypothetical protein
MVSAAERQNLDGMAESISHHKYARRLVESKTAQFEVSGFFKDLGTDLPCKIRPDVLDKSLNVISDFKGMIDASWDEFSKKIFNYGFHISAAWYRYGHQVIEGHDCDFVIIACEKEPPYGVNTFLMRGRSMKAAEEKIANVMGPLAECFNTGKWPSYDQILREPDVPGWVKYD